MPAAMGQTMGWLRAAVGAGLVVAPRWSLRLSGREEPTGASTLLMRTIGIRDLVLGCGTVVAARRGGSGDLARWTRVGLASDSLDVVASLASRRSIGETESYLAALAALVFAVGDSVALRTMGAEPAAPPGAG